MRTPIVIVAGSLLTASAKRRKSKPKSSDQSQWRETEPAHAD
jgi:hypothetical protein